jgi:hypothetical protein
MRFLKVALLVLWVPALATSADPKPEKFIRIQRDEDNQPVALETVIAHYDPAGGEKGVEIDLVAVVHIGEKGYYKKFNKAFEKYDVVLFELVAPEGTTIPKGGRKEKSDNPLAMVQQVMKTLLRLEFQLEQVDYTAKNFVHADLSPEGMKKAMKERGDDEFTVVLGVVADFMRKKNLAAEKGKPQQPQIPRSSG